MFGSRFTKLLSGTLIFCILFSSQIALAQTTSGYYTPGNTNYVSNNTFGGQVFNTGASILIGCTSGILAGGASKGIASLAGTLSKNKVTDISKKAGVNIQSNSEVKVSDKETNDNTAQTNKISACLDAAAYVAAQQSLQGMSQRVLNWVNTGLGGNPLYVRDVGSYLTSIQNKKVSDFLGNSVSSNSIYGQAVQSVIRQATTGVDDKYFSKINGANYQYTYTTVAGTALYCPQDYQSLYNAQDAACLKTPADPTGATDTVAQCRTQMRVKYDNLATQNCVGDTVKKFNDFQNDFTSGGWDAFLNSIQNDDNNPIGALFKASDSLSKSVTVAQQQATDEINRNGGFLDMKVCTQWSKTKLQTYCANAENTSNPACADPTDKTYCANHPNNPACQLGGDATPQCLSYQTTTPGKIIADSVNEVTKTPIVNAENVDKINQVLSSFFNNLLSNFLQGGLGLLQNKGSSIPSYAVSYGDNTVYNADGSSYQNPFANITQNSYDTSQFDISRPQDLRAVIQAQADYVNKIEDARSALEKLVPYTGKLDYILPGPNPTWADYVDQNFNELMSSFIVENNDGRKQQFVGNAVEQTGTTVGSLLVATGVGSVAGVIVIAASFIVGEIIKLINNPHFRFWFESPTLTDKATGGTVTVGILPDGRHYDSYTGQNASTSGNPILYFEHAYNVLRLMYADKYNPKTFATSLGNAYAALVTTQADKDFARGFVTQALAATSKLPQYAQSAPAVEDDYTTQIADTQNTIVQLNNIMDQINIIINGNGKAPGTPGYIEGAKKRYIREHKASNPVDVNTVTIDTRTGGLATASTPAANTKIMSCIDYAYQINTTPIVGTARQTTDTIDPIVVQSEAASDYFYGSMQTNP